MLGTRFALNFLAFKIKVATNSMIVKTIKMMHAAPPPFNLKGGILSGSLIAEIVSCQNPIETVTDVEDKLTKKSYFVETPIDKINTMEINNDIAVAP
jgi:hypothetical protein